MNVLTITINPFMASLSGNSSVIATQESLPHLLALAAKVMRGPHLEHASIILIISSTPNTPIVALRKTCRLALSEAMPNMHLLLNEESNQIDSRKLISPSLSASAHKEHYLFAVRLQKNAQP